MMGRLSGSVAIVTGAAGGIGLGIAERFALEGATVVATDVQGLTRDSAVAIRQHDVTDRGQWSALLEDVLAAHGKVDVLVNNAGVAGYHDIVETPVDEWQRIVAINQTGVLFGMQSVIPAMRANGAGSIVNVSSICGSTAVPGVAAYHATKGAVITMTKNAAVSYARDGI
ncbi:MAG: SDR family NAD(P)-dependent oxidoreductase, partial [Rhodococcus fascians]